MQVSASWLGVPLLAGSGVPVARCARCGLAICCSSLGRHDRLRLLLLGCLGFRVQPELRDRPGSDLL